MLVTQKFRSPAFAYTLWTTRLIPPPHAGQTPKTPMAAIAATVHRPTLWMAAMIHCPAETHGCHHSPKLAFPCVVDGCHGSLPRGDPWLPCFTETGFPLREGWLPSFTKIANCNSFSTMSAPFFRHFLHFVMHGCHDSLKLCLSLVCHGSPKQCFPSVGDGCHDSLRWQP